MTSLPLIQGFMPLQALVEIALLLGLCSAIAYVLERNGLKLNKLFQVGVLFSLLILYWVVRIYPPLPFSILAIYITGIALGIFGWVSSNEKFWKDFKKPILATLDGVNRPARIARGILVIAIPVAVGLLIFQSMLFVVNEPVELRVYHPAPPATITVDNPKNFPR